MGAIRRRISAVLAAAVLAVRLLAPDVGHACDASRVDSQALAPIETATDAHAHHHAAPTLPAASTAAAEQGHNAGHVDQTSAPAHECDCDTECCCVATAVTAVRALPRITAQYVASAQHGFSHHAAWESSWVHHVLPFTTAPPTATLS